MPLLSSSYFSFFPSFKCKLWQIKFLYAFLKKKRQFQKTLQKKKKSWNREEERDIGSKQDEKSTFKVSDELLQWPQGM